ncbi:MAG: propionyl-CoA synthetase [Pseudomonadota bacterium]
MGSFRNEYEASLADPEAFWMAQAEAVDWTKRPTRALDDSKAPFYRWFADGECNTCWNAVDRHVEAGHGGRVAIIYESPITGDRAEISYAELQERVARLAGAMARQGVGKGDRVILYMPMVPEAVVAMLACARLGAVHSVVFGGFAAHELAVRIDDAKPKAILSASCGIEPGRVVPYKPLLDAAIAHATHKPDFCVVLQREQAAADLTEGRDHDWEAFQEGAEPAPCAAVGGADPLYVLYTSGTTGQPKGVVRPNAGHMVALIWTMRNIYDIGPGDVWFTASDVGWVVGHSYIVYAPLLVGATTIVFEGKPVGTPDAGVLWRIIAENGAKAFFTAPTAFRAVRRQDPHGEFIQKTPMPSLETLFFAGERADPATVEWVGEKLGVPVVDHWWQTETGYAIAANPMGLEPQPFKTGSPTLPMPGYDLQILDEGGNEVAAGQLGAIALKLPLPPGTLPTLWGNDARFQKSYLERFPGYYETGDAGYVDEDGYVYIMARTDDVINVAGHRLSTGAMEEVLARHPDVAECAVIGAADELKGQVPVGFLCLTAGCDRPHDEIVRECVKLVREEIGPVAFFKSAVVVDRLPKTRSGKILRGIMARIADGQEFKMPATIDDPAILDEVGSALETLGYSGMPSK